MLKRFLACVVVLGVMTPVATAEVVFQWEPTEFKVGENTTLTLSVFTNEPRELGVGGFFFFLDDTDPEIQLKDFRFDPVFTENPFYLDLVDLERPDTTIQTVFTFGSCSGICIMYPPDGSKLTIGELDVLVEQLGSFILNLDTLPGAEATDAEGQVGLQIKGGLETKLTVVPEPASLGLLLLGTLAMARRRR